ncbi:hypothetical protein [Paracoccus sp. (in: a-proteobacteria)]|uniref:hypothetical protein n=1 Tax=Paracoccus sp. TaxID=267 RepID=UPI002AFF7204|nr:hypothetical protein [Paracoccus sp. (in: a-proteobacteria)]
MFEGNRGISASAGFEKDNKNIVDDSVFNIPGTLTPIEVASVLYTLMDMFSGEINDAAQEVFALSLIQQIDKGNYRAEGQLGDWVFLLLYDTESKWRIVVRKPDL